jgi:hypothetical protein
MALCTLIPGALHPFFNFAVLRNAYAARAPEASAIRLTIHQPPYTHTPIFLGEETSNDATKT